MTEQELLEALEKSIESNNRNNLDLIKVLNGTDTQDVTLQDGSVVPSLSKRVQAEVVEDSNYLFKSDNLASVENKQTARTNLGVPSVTEMNTAITNATPNATETTIGKARIATSAEVQAGTTANVIVTPQTLKESVFAFGVDWRDVSTSRAVNTNYVNTLPRTIVVRICFFVNAQSTFTSIKVDGKERDQVGSSAWASNSFTALSAEVPSGKTFRFDVPSGSVSQIQWGEL